MSDDLPGLGRLGMGRVPKPRIVDLVFGSRAKGVRFAWYKSDESAQVRRTTDHPLIVARTVVKARKVR